MTVQTQLRIGALFLIVQLGLAACSPRATAAPAPTSAPPTAAPPTAVPASATPAAATATSAPAATATALPPTATAAPPTATTAPSATPEAATETVTLQFAKPLSTIEELEDVAVLLNQVPGIEDITGNENQVNVIFDPQVIDVNGIVAAMATIGFPVVPPG
ncbi:MAG: hypothetical protein IT318_00170 [Anaerolineales bacterium]|nr:hypothetical protein [Anaerolineales bacterium]